MIEVFICFHSEDQAMMVLDTAERWRKTKGAYPTVIQIPKDGFEIKRRVLADKLAKTDFYIIADILCVPAMPKFIETIEKHCNDKVGLAGIVNMYEDIEQYPVRLRICRKGIVEKWPKQETLDYNKEHADAVTRAGKKVEIWHDIKYLYIQPAIPRKRNATIH